MQGNPYGLDSLWLQGDFVIRGVAILLLLLSIASWYVIVTKALQLLRYRRASAVAGRQFWDASNVQEGVAALGSNNPYADLAQAGVKAMHHHSAHQGHLHDQLSVSDWVTLSLRQAIDANQLNLRIATPAQKTPQPELHLRAERTTQYEKVAQVMAAAQSGGLSKIGFVTEPEKK